jgi:hypothetical protein
VVSTVRRTVRLSGVGLHHSDSFITPLLFLLLPSPDQSSASSLLPLHPHSPRCLSLVGVSVSPSALSCPAIAPTVSKACRTHHPRPAQAAGRGRHVRASLAPHLLHPTNLPAPQGGGWVSPGSSSPCHCRCCCRCRRCRHTRQLRIIPLPSSPTILSHSSSPFTPTSSALHCRSAYSLASHPPLPSSISTHPIRSTFFTFHLYLTWHQI